MNAQSSQNAWLGPALMCLTSLLFALLDTGTKYLAMRYPVNQIIWARYVFQMVILFAIFIRPRGLSLLRVNSMKVQIVRGLFLCAVSVLIINGLARLPLAEATTMMFTTPIILTLLSGVILHEPARRLDWLAVLCGFAGVLIIVRPGGSLFVWAILFPLAAAVCNAFYQIVTRWIRNTEDSVTTNLYSGMVGAVVLLPLGLPGWVSMTPFDFVMLILLGAAAGLGHLSLTLALDYSTAPRLAPYSYLQIFWATLLGWLVFTTAPDILSWLGILIIAAGGLLISAEPLRRLAMRRIMGRDEP